MKVLVVDDSQDNRELLEYILEDEGFVCVHAKNGREACEKYKSDREINLILMDVSMPEMDGLEATRRIKSVRANDLITIIFVTALNDPSVLQECLNAGGDDFVAKPVDENVLLAKINAHRRTSILYSSLKQAKKELEYHKRVIDREHAIVERIFDRSTHRTSTYCSNVKSYSSPMSMFNGDITLVAPSSSGGVYCLVGDFTGHGLASAIGTLPVMDVFYRMSKKHRSIGVIAKELNRSLVDVLPENMFFCAAICYVDNMGRSMSLWAGGMNDVLRLSQNTLTEISSEHMPLGVLSECEFDETPLVLDLAQGERIYIYTDGVNEATNSAGVDFGVDGIKEVLLSGKEDLLSELVDAVHHFEAGVRNDDISVMEITAGPLVHCSKSDDKPVDYKALSNQVDSYSWKFAMRLDGAELASTNIVDQIMALISSIDGLEFHQEKLFTIISELYSNALEHGVLRLSSSLKSTVDGFEEYYRLRAERLLSAEEEFVELSFCFNKAHPCTVEITITDSGCGFNYQAVSESIVGEYCSYGRGLPLLRHLCSELVYSNSGRTVKAVYVLDGS